MVFSSSVDAKWNRRGWVWRFGDESGRFYQDIVLYKIKFAYVVEHMCFVVHRWLATIKNIIILLHDTGNYNLMWFIIVLHHSNHQNAAVSHTCQSIMQPARRGRSKYFDFTTGWHGGFRLHAQPTISVMLSCLLTYKNVCVFCIQISVSIVSFFSKRQTNTNFHIIPKS